MTDLQRDVLRILRIFGPCSNADVARRLKVSMDRTYRDIVLLTELGYAVHPKLQRWDITDAGREYFERMPSRELALFDDVRFGSPEK